MDSSEVEFITSNKHRLKDNIIYSSDLTAFLEQVGHLCKVDTERLDAKEKNDGNSAAVVKLLDILVTRSGSYASLVEALGPEVTNQTGAEKILQELDRSSLRGRTIPIQRYWQVPRGLQRFLESESNSMYCIICTPDCGITCEKIKEIKRKNCHINEWKEFLGIISNSGIPAKDAIYVAKNCSIKNLMTLDPLCDNDNKLHSKKVFVTCEDINEINEILPSWRNKVELMSDHMDWNDLSLSFKTEITEKLEKKYGVDLVKERFDGQSLVDLINGKELKLFKETLPKELSFYIGRTLSTRTYISTNIFEQDSPDVFLFTEVDSVGLSTLTSEQTDTSTNQLLQDDIDVKFMLMDDPIHFKKIAKKCCHPIHLISYEDKRLKWIKSNGSIKTILDYVDESQNQLEEERFLLNANLNGNQAVIISDSHGMGKSVFLGKIGRRLQSKYPTRTVFFLVLSKFITHFTGKSEMKQDELITKVTGVLQDMLCENIVGRAALKQQFNSEEISIELLLHGFDELETGDFYLACEVLKGLSSIKSVRLWVTTRPHLINKLENLLNVFGYKLNLFDENRQIEFLSSYWSLKGQSSRIKLKEFAKECLENLIIKMDSSDSDIAAIAGIPRQCLVLAQVFEDEAHSFANAGPASPKLSLITNITDFYKSLTDKIIRNFLDARAIQSDRDQVKKYLMDMHTKLSLELAFPEEVEKVDDKMTVVQFDELLKVGLVELSGPQGTPKFLHQTFGDYLVASFAVDKLKDENGWEQTMMELASDGEWFLKKLICGKNDKDKKTYPTIAYFMNALMVDLKSVTPPIQISPLLLKKWAIFQTALMKISVACAKHNFANILKFLDNLKVFQEHSDKVFNKDYLLLCIDYAELEMVKFVLERFERKPEWERDINIRAEVLYCAISRGKFSIVDFLLKKKGLRPLLDKGWKYTGDFIHVCVKTTSGTSVPEIEERVQILRLIIGEEKKRLEIKDKDGDTPLLLDNIHVKLRIELIRLGAKVLALNRSGHTFLHRIKNSYTSEEYHNLVIALSDNFKVLAHKKNREGYSPLLHITGWIDPLPATLTLYEKVGADFNLVRPYDGLSMLAVAIIEGWSGVTLRRLREYGSNIRWKSADGANLVHIAARAGNAVAIKILVEENNLNVNKYDSNCKYELHHVTESAQPFAATKLLLELGAKTFYLDKKGNTPFHSLMERIHFDYATAKLLKSATDVKWKPALAHFWMLVIIQNEVENVEKELNAFKQECAKCKVELDFILNDKNDKEGNSLLHLAAKYSFDRAVRYLVELKELNVNYKNKKQQTALHTAVAGFSKEIELNIIKYLIANKAEVDAADDTGFIFLHLYIKYMNNNELDIGYLRPLAEYLITKGYSSLFEVPGGENHCTPMHLLFQSKYTDEPDNETLAWLCSKGVNFNVVDINGKSIVNYAIIGGKSKDCISNLIRLGADWTIQCNQNYNALHISANLREMDILKLFLELGGLDVNGVNVDGNTPLHAAVLSEVQTSIREKCQLLINWWADIRIKNKMGYTPLALALMIPITGSDGDSTKERIKLWRILDGYVLSPTIGASSALWQANIIEGDMDDNEWETDENDSDHGGDQDQQDVVDYVLQLMRDRLLKQQYDTVIEAAWRALWDLTDNMPVNCHSFLKMDGMSLLISCFQKFSNNPILFINMTGTMWNVTAVCSLRTHPLASPFISMFSNLLDFTEDNGEVSLQAAGALNFLLADDGIWNENVTRGRVMIQEEIASAISQWDMNSNLQINLRGYAGKCPAPISKIFCVVTTLDVQ